MEPKKRGEEKEQLVRQYRESLSRLFGLIPGTCDTCGKYKFECLVDQVKLGLKCIDCIATDFASLEMKKRYKGKDE